VYGDEDEIAAIMKEVKRHRALILDLRNNGGGSVLTTAYLLGQFFDRDIEIATYRRRSGDSAYVAKARDKDPYRGMVLVLMNSNSASASEVTARTLQLQGRGIIVGDRSMGAVVTSQTHWHELGFGRKVTYGVQVSVMDLIMPDGQRLENIGVIPDVPMLPSGADMAARRDPVMAKALSMVGMTLDPVEAATVYRDGKRM
jgi:carboxyl-terminal processing protease